MNCYLRVRLTCSLLLSAAVPGSAALAQKPGTIRAAPVSEQIIVDQFGWRVDAPRKVAIVADPEKGQNAAHRYVPGDTFEVRRVSDGKTVFSGKTVSWRSGALHSVSGDHVWWCDFSALRIPGRYVVYDPKNRRQSYPFSIGNDVYRPVLTASTRTFFYQRCGTPIEAGYGGNWNRGACHVGPEQDRTAQLYIDSPKGARREVSGGWHDAGDDTKYVPFLPGTLGDLMLAYELNPRAFGDRTGIPESGNGVPDVLDEIKWELDWLRKMQNPDGSVCNRVSQRSYNSGPGPTADTQPRYYTQPTTWATAIYAGIMAHAARIYPTFAQRYPGYGARLKQAALRAWGYLEKHPEMLPKDGKDGAQMAAAPGDSNSHADRRLRLLAAVELFATTGEPRFHAYFKANYKDKPNTEESNHHPLVDGHFDTTQTTDLNLAFFEYARAKNADQGIVAEIKTALRNTMENIYISNYQKDEDPYRAYMYDGHYCWGSNQIKSHWGTLVLYAITLHVNPTHEALYREIAEEYLHYFHGRNPLSLVYLSNMGVRGARTGASKSVMEIYHHWFQDGSPLYDGPRSKFGPAPGFLVGGPNQFFSRSWISPPHGEPPMKAFREWNTAWNKQQNDNENSWEVTEPAIYYQAAYTLLVSYFAPPAAK